MDSSERRALGGLAALYIFRMLGLFMVLPVLSVYGSDYRDSTPLLIGAALGAYGLSQALLQIPFGALSDRIGRKPVIYLGLSLFALGSVVAALTDSVYGLIVGRVLQGCGAIAAATMALLADLTRDENRGKAMAAIGAAIGLSFLLAVVLGPVLASQGGLPAIFWLTAGLALTGMLLVWRLVPSPQVVPVPRNYRLELKYLVRSSETWVLVSGVFFSHMLLTALFVPLPLLLVDQLGLATASHWKLYAPLLFISFLIMLPLMRLAEIRHRVPQAMACALVGLGAGSLALLGGVSGVVLVLLLGVFFVAFNLLEALLPAQLTRTATAQARGAATGMYATLQFLGTFFGGVAGGYLFGLGRAPAVALLGFGVLVVWALIWWQLRNTAPAPDGRSAPE